MGLSQRQKECLDWIKSHIAVHGYPPTRRELSGFMDVGTTTVNRYIEALEDAGEIIVIPKASRGIKVK